MISFIEGIVEYSGNNTLIVKQGGIGFELSASSFTVAQMGKLGASVRLFTHLILKEDGITLYGFGAREEKAMFLRLISISGIGPKLAISILSGIRLDELATAILRGGIARLTAIKGVGKKTAERILLELKDKLHDEFAQSEIPDSMPNIDDDAILALMSMGFSKQEAVQAIKRVSKNGLSTEELIINALKG